MTGRRLLVGLLILAVLPVLWLGIFDSSDNGSVAPIAPPVDANLPVANSAEPQPQFPEADLQAGLAALCSNDAPPSTGEEPPLDYEETIQAASERLAMSSSAEHLVVAALLQDDSASRIELLKRAVSAGPRDPLVIWTALKICSDPRASPDCPSREWGQQLIAVDGQNSESWMRVATIRYASGEVAAALEAMRFASAAAQSSAYYTETIEAIERALRAVGDLDFPRRASIALGIQPGLAEPGWRVLTDMCRDQSAVSPEWADACLRYGELVEQQGETELSVSIARSVQRLVLATVGESERAAAVEERIQAREQERLAAAGNMDITAWQVVLQSPTLFYSYLAAIRSEGEEAAQRLVATEVERLVRQRPELACE
jgi:hypothetical protein